MENSFSVVDRHVKDEMFTDLDFDQHGCTRLYMMRIEIGQWVTQSHDNDESHKISMMSRDQRSTCLTSVFYQLS